jgi:hypothetical protein
MSSTPEQIATALKRLADIEAIKQLKARYVRCADGQLWEEWGNEVLAEDCILESEAGIHEGRDCIIAAISESLNGAKTVHRVTTPEITLTGPDTASAIWPVQDFVTMTLNGAPYAFNGSSYYEEDYVRTAAGWRLKHSKLVRQQIDRTAG